jgi:two-component system sensor histidine kinase KdpD
MYDAIPVNATTAGFAYLLFVLIVASTWGFWEASASSIVAATVFNYFFFEPKLTFSIADPKNWVAVGSFLATSLIASRLSTEARRQAMEAAEKQRHLERLYSFGRAILLLDDRETFSKRLTETLADAFDLDAVALYEQRTDVIHRAGRMDFDGMDSQLREAALQGLTFADPDRNRVITAVRLGSAPIASLALQGSRIPDSVLQSIANLVAIGLERAWAQELAREGEISKRSEQLRTTLIDAMAHKLKTPLTSIRAATSALLAGGDLKTNNATRMLKIADEEATHLESLINNTLDLAQLDSDHIDLQLEKVDLNETIREVVGSMKDDIGDRRVDCEAEGLMPLVAMDRRLIKIVIEQLLENALKYSPAQSPIKLRTFHNGSVGVEVSDHGNGIPEHEQRRIFDRFYRSPTVQSRTPGSGLGLNIAKRIIQAHRGDLRVHSRPGETVFRLELPLNSQEEHH